MFWRTCRFIVFILFPVSPHFPCDSSISIKFHRFSVINSDQQEGSSDIFGYLYHPRTRWPILDSIRAFFAQLRAASHHPLKPQRLIRRHSALWSVEAALQTLVQGLYMAPEKLQNRRTQNTQKHTACHQVRPHRIQRELMEGGRR